MGKELTKLNDKTSNSNHSLKSAVGMPICVLKRGNFCDRMSSRENEARFLQLNEVQRNKMAANLEFAQAAQRKHKIRLAVSHIYS